MFVILKKYMWLFVILKKHVWDVPNFKEVTVRCSKS